MKIPKREGFSFEVNDHGGGPEMEVLRESDNSLMVMFFRGKGKTMFVGELCDQITPDELRITADLMEEINEVRSRP